MSCPAIIRVYEEALEEFLLLVTALGEAGVEIDALLDCLDAEDHDAVLDVISDRPELYTLQIAAQNLKDHYGHIKELERFWSNVDKFYEYLKALYVLEIDYWDVYLDDNRCG